MRVKLYDVMANGHRTDALPEEEVAKLYAAGALHRRSPCRVYGTHEWHSIDECLPLLKYTPQSPPADASSALAADRPVSPTRRETLDTDGAGAPARTTALRAGWICLGIGLSVAWFFPPAYFLFSVGIVTAI